MVRAPQTPAQKEQQALLNQALNQNKLNFIGDVHHLKSLLDRYPQAQVTDYRDLQGNTPLHLACVNGNPEVIEYLVQLGADLASQNNRLKTPLELLEITHGKHVMHWVCAEFKSPDLIRSFIKVLGESSLKAKNYLKETPLYVAVEKNQSPAVIQTLLDNKARFYPKKQTLAERLRDSFPNKFKGSKKDHALTWAILGITDPKIIQSLIDTLDDRDFLFSANTDNQTIMHLAARYNPNAEVFQVLIKNGVDFFTKKDNQGNTPLDILKEEHGKDLLHWAFRGMTDRHSLQTFIDKVDDKDSYLYVQDDKGQIPLHLAIRNNLSPETICTLTEKQALICSDINHKTPIDFLAEQLVEQHGDHALHWAISTFTKTDIIQTLIPYLPSDNINTKNADGETPLYVVIQQTTAFQLIQTLLDHDAALQSDSKPLPDLLIEKYGTNALFWALGALSDLDLIDDLMNKIVDTQDNQTLQTLKDTFGNTLIHWAATNPNVTVLKSLLNKAAFKSFDFNTKNNVGMTALHMAATANQNPKVFITLIQHHADDNILDNTGRSPIDILKAKHGDDLASWASQDIDSPVFIQKLMDIFKEKHGEYILHWAIQHIKNPVLIQKLIQDPDNKASINLTDESGETPLHKALYTAKISDIPRFTLTLIENGADLSIEDREGKSALSLLKEIYDIKLFDRTSNNQPDDLLLNFDRPKLSTWGAIKKHGVLKTLAYALLFPIAAFITGMIWIVQQLIPKKAYFLSFIEKQTDPNTLKSRTLITTEVYAHTPFSLTYERLLSPIIKLDAKEIEDRTYYTSCKGKKAQQCLL